MKPERAFEESANDEARVCKLNEQLINGWNQGDGEAFAAAFAEDGDLIGFDGTHLKVERRLLHFNRSCSING